jgi:L-lysine 6-transaminase
VIEADDLFAAAQERGAALLAGLRRLAAIHDTVSNPRGLGLMCAVTMPNRAIRDRVLAVLLESEHVIMLGCGDRSLRVRPALTVTSDVVADALAALDRAIDVVKRDQDRDGDAVYA